MHVLCIGQAVYDITFPLRETLIENQKYRIEERNECMGAPAANAAYLNALWGIPTSLIARIGHDVYGEEIQRELQQVGVNTATMYVENDLRTSISCILTNKRNGNRTIINAPMKPHAFDIPVLRVQPTVILVDGHENDASLQAFQAYPEAITILDGGTYKAALTDVILHIDYLVCSQDFANQYTNISIDVEDATTWNEVFTKLKQLHPRHLVVTLGEQGLLYEDEQGLPQHIPAFPSKPIDTTGAGDIFHGAFAYCVAHHFPLRDSLIIAAMSAAISVETPGAKTSIPTKATVQKRLVEQGFHFAL